MILLELQRPILRREMRLNAAKRRQGIAPAMVSPTISGAPPFPSGDQPHGFSMKFSVSLKKPGSNPGFLRNLAVSP